MAPDAIAQITLLFRQTGADLSHLVAAALELGGVDDLLVLRRLRRAGPEGADLEVRRALEGDRIVGRGIGLSQLARAQ